MFSLGCYEPSMVKSFQAYKNKISLLVKTFSVDLKNFPFLSDF